MAPGSCGAGGASGVLRRRSPVAPRRWAPAGCSRCAAASSMGCRWRNRAAVVDLPNVVVLGPAGSGKTQLIGLDVDWQRQARQFLPSYTSDALLQFYLGPDCVVQEVSAPLLEDETLQARGALRRMWQKSFSHKQKGMAVLVLDVRWLADTPPDEQRRMAQLLRGKLNLMSEACRGPVETRLCLTHMDGLEGFEDFARMLKQHGVPLLLRHSEAGRGGPPGLAAGGAGAVPGPGAHLSAGGGLRAPGALLFSGRALVLGARPLRHRAAGGRHPLLQASADAGVSLLAQPGGPRQRRALGGHRGEQHPVAAQPATCAPTCSARR